MHSVTGYGNQANFAEILLGKIIREIASSQLILGGFQLFENHRATAAAELLVCIV